MDNLQEKPQPPSPSQRPMELPLQPLNSTKTSPPLLLLMILVIFGFGAAAGIFAFYSKVILPKKSARKQSKAVAPQPRVIPKNMTAVVSPASVPETSQSPSPSQKTTPVLALTGILFGEEGSFALINGKVVAEGAMVDGAKLQKVYSDRVELSFEGKTLILRSR